MLGRLITGAGLMRTGMGMVRRGQELRKRPKQERTSAIINRVRMKTRGIHGTSNPRLFSKATFAGQKRRDQAAALMRGKRAGLPAGHTHASYAAAQSAKHAEASRSRSRQIVKNVKGVTRSVVPAHWLSKKNKSGRINRQVLAGFLREARQGPTKGYGSRAKEVFDLRKKRNHRGSVA